MPASLYSSPDVWWNFAFSPIPSLYPWALPARVVTWPIQVGWMILHQYSVVLAQRFSYSCFGQRRKSVLDNAEWVMVAYGCVTQNDTAQTRGWCCLPPEILLTSIKKRQLLLPIILIGIVGYACVEQPLSKQLYTLLYPDQLTRQPRRLYSGCQC